jgi:hypothetical protein
MHGDLDPPANPHSLMADDVVEEPLERRDASRPTAEPGV